MPFSFQTCRLQWQRSWLLLVTVLYLLAPSLSHAIEFGWSRPGKDVLYGEVTEFNFDKKTVTIKESDSEKEKTFPSSQLDSRSKWILLLFSPVFFNSIPQDGFETAHWLLSIIFIVVPALTYLFSFWFCAIIVTRRINPLRALVALVGAWLLSGFLIVFYIFMIGRHPDQTTPICIIGGLITTTVASLFISIIYHKKIIHGFALIVLHSILAPVILASAIYLPYKFGDKEQVDTLFEDILFIPVGILPEEKDET